MNSRQKGKRGERAWRDELRAQGFEARRGQQFAGSAESPDVVCPGLWWLHFEVKCVERLNIEDAMAQARRDVLAHGHSFGGKVPIVAHKRNFCGWLVTMDAETFFKFLRGDFLDERSPSPQPNDSRLSHALGSSEPFPPGNSFRRFPSDSSPPGEGEDCAQGLTRGPKDEERFGRGESSVLTVETET